MPQSSFVDIKSNLLSGAYAERLASIRTARLDEAHKDFWPFFDELSSQLHYLLDYSPCKGSSYVKPGLIVDECASGLLDLYVNTCTLVPQHKSNSLYQIAWEACVEKQDIRYLHLLSGLGCTKYKGIARLFQDDVMCNKGGDGQAITFYTSPLTDRSALANHEAAEKNRDRLQSKNSTFWLNLLNEYSLSLPIHYEGGGCLVKECSPVFSLMAGEAIGSFIGHVYKVEHQVVVPIYADMIRELVGVLLFDRNVAILSFTKKARQWNADGIIESFITPLREMLSTHPAQINSSPDAKRCLVPCGAMNNYGHTVINESAVYEMLASCRQPLVNHNLYPLLCSKDYLNSIDILRSSWQDEELILLDECTLSQLPFGRIIDGIIVPVCSYLPTFLGLRACWDRSTSVVGISPSLLPTDAYSSRAVYWAIGGRSGKRECSNILESLSYIVPTLLKYGVCNLILDSTTAIPNYTRDLGTRLIGESFSRVSESSYIALVSQLVQTLSGYGLNVIDINGYAFREKVATCKSFVVPVSVAPYGSSAMFPLYFLNNHVLLAGSEVFESYVNEWKWHVTKYCHPSRLIEEIYLQSLQIDSSGHQLDLKILDQAVKDALDSFFG